MKKYSWDLLRVGTSFFFSNHLTTQALSLISKKCYHVCIHVIVGTWDPLWSGKSQLPCSQRLILHELTSSDLGCRTCGTPCEPAITCLVSVLLFYQWQIITLQGLCIKGHSFSILETFWVGGLDQEQPCLLRSHNDLLDRFICNYSEYYI